MRKNTNFSSNPKNKARGMKWLASTGHHGMGKQRNTTGVKAILPAWQRANLLCWNECSLKQHLCWR